MTIEKNIIIKERKNVWAILLEVRHDAFIKGGYTDELATFSKRPMALVAMASSVNSFKKLLMADHLIIHATVEAVEKLESVGIYDPATCDA